MRLEERAEKIKFLNGFSEALSEVEEAEMKIKALMGISAIVQDGMPRSSEKRDLSEKIFSLLQAKEEERKAIKNAVDKTVVIMSAIDKLGSRTERDILRLRYIEIKSWQEVDKEIGYSSSMRKRYHEKALEHLEPTFCKKK